MDLVLAKYVSHSLFTTSKLGLENMEEPKSRLDTDMMFVNTAGQIYFMCYGKHTGEEYSTDCIDMLTVLKHFSDNIAATVPGNSYKSPPQLE